MRRVYLCFAILESPANVNFHLPKSRIQRRVVHVNAPGDCSARMRLNRDRPMCANHLNPLAGR